MGLNTNLLKFNNKTTGFTIVELLIVIVVIGILAAITLTSYTGITAKANNATLISDLANNTKKLSMYNAQYGEYPHINSTTGCPEAPSTIDNNYCLKFSAGNTFTHTYKTPTTYELTTNKGVLSYIATESTSPSAIVLGDANWITIGTQRWAKANLNVGTMVTGVTNQTNNGTVEKYCYNDNTANCTTYGGLYQWDEAMQYVTTESTRGICPVGSHVPSDNDWKILEMQLGMTQEQVDNTAWRGSDQGTKLRTGGISGFNTSLSGGRIAGGVFNGVSSYDYFWSSTESSTTAWLRHLNTSYITVSRYPDAKDYGFSIRCLGN